jgi:hypothetical protein
VIALGEASLEDGFGLLSLQRSGEQQYEDGAEESSSRVWVFPEGWLAYVV